MIKKLRIKFILLTASVLLVLFSVQLYTMYAFMSTTSESKTQRLMEEVVHYDGVPPNMRNFQGGYGNGDEREGHEERFFYVKTDHNGRIFEAWTDMFFNMTEENVLSYVNTVSDQKAQTGTLGAFSYLSVPTDYGKIMVFAERATQNFMLTQLSRITLIVLSAGCVILIIFVVILSKWVVKPVEDAFMRQKRFVSDASHELRTPITTISANADMLENEIGQNTWLTHIKKQSSRMSELINNLLSLARADEAELPMMLFNLSTLVQNTVLEFESRAYEEKKEYTYEIEDNIFCLGDNNSIKQVLEILIDNALKHSEENSKVSVTLESASKNAQLTVFNTGQGIDRSEYEKVFERFYRSDSSRSRQTGGYGLGLAIAKSIIDRHKGTIKVYSEKGNCISFIVLLHRQK